jgi:HEAT repeat protein
MNRRRIAILAGTIISIVGIGLLLGGGTFCYCLVAKCYEGKPASYWIKTLQDDDPAVAGKAIEALFRIAPPSKEAAQLLLQRIQADPNSNQLPNVPAGHASPERASYALERVLEALGPEGKEFVPSLIELLHDPGVFHRMRACRLLGALGPNARKAIPELTQARSDEFPPVGEEADRALKKVLDLVGTANKN